jgi:hypothetical protein
VVKARRDIRLEEVFALKSEFIESFSSVGRKQAGRWTILP